MSEGENTMIETSCLLIPVVIGMSVLGVLFIFLVAHLIEKGYL